MSEDYTPSMADLREAYVLSRTRDSLHTEAVIAEARADANRAIAAHDKELREKIAREIEEYGEKMAVASHDWHNEAARRSAYSNAARIARGKEQA